MVGLDKIDISVKIWKDKLSSFIYKKYFFLSFFAKMQQGGHSEKKTAR
jgi:hypothetical protein